MIIQPAPLNGSTPCVFTSLSFPKENGTVQPAGNFQSFVGNEIQKVKHSHDQSWYSYKVNPYNFSHRNDVTLKKM